VSPCAQIIRSGGVANGRGAATQAGQRVGLAQSTAYRAGQFKGLLMMRLCSVAGVLVGEGLLKWCDGRARIEPCERMGPAAGFRSAAPAKGGEPRHGSAGSGVGQGRDAACGVHNPGEYREVIGRPC
jgi:hypothetical protein